MSKIHKTFIEHEAALRRYLSRFLARSQDVDDLTQEVFLRAFAAESKTKILAPKAYLYRVAKNLALKALAKKSFTDTDYMEDFDDPGFLKDNEQLAVDEQVAQRQHLMIVSEAILTLPAQCRRVFMMRNVDGFSYKEISRRLSITESTVEKHVAKGLLKCTEVLRRQGYNLKDFGIEKKFPIKNTVQELQDQNVVNLSREK